MSKEFLIEKDGGIVTLTINRPEFGNAFARDMYGEIADTFDKLGQDDDVRCIIITGSGKHFSAGGDINRFKTLIESKEYVGKDGVIAAANMSRAVKKCPKPVIAMINGAAAGAGCSLALASDFRVMEENSKLVMAFINMGFTVDTGGMWYLMQTIGAARTTEMLMLGNQITGDKALEWGLCNVLAEDGKLHEETLKLAKKLASKPTMAIGMQKELMYQYFYNDLASFAEDEAKYMVKAGRTNDHAEAVYAFLEKRKPEFKGN